MSQLERINPDNSLIRLSDEQMLQPFRVLEDFCSAFTPGQLRSILMEMVETCLTIEADLFQNPDKRADSLYVAKKIELVIEAVFLIVGLKNAETPNSAFLSDN